MQTTIRQLMEFKKKKKLIIFFIIFHHHDVTVLPAGGSLAGALSTRDVVSISSTLDF